MPEVLGEHRLEMTPGDDPGSPPERFSPTARRLRSPGRARTGLRIGSTPTEAKTASKLVVNLASRSRRWNRDRCRRSSRSDAKFLVTRVTQAPSGLALDVEYVDDAAFELDQEDQVVAAEQHVDGARPR